MGESPVSGAQHPPGQGPCPHLPLTRPPPQGPTRHAHVRVAGKAGDLGAGGGQRRICGMGHVPASWKLVHRTILLFKACEEPQVSNPTC